MPGLSPTIIAAAQSGTNAAALDGVAGWVVSVIEAIGNLGVALLIALENVFPPIPSEVILPLAGFTAGRPDSSMTLVTAVIFATIGSVVGAWVLYGLGRVLGEERTRAFLLWLPLTKESDVQKTEDWFNAHGRWTVFLGRMIPIFRSLISLPAGVVKMNLIGFTLLTAVGSAIWNALLIWAGYLLGQNWTAVQDYVGYFAYAVVAIIVLALAWWVIKRVRENRATAE